MSLASGQLQTLTTQAALGKDLYRAGRWVPQVQSFCKQFFNLGPQHLFLFSYQMSPQAKSRDLHLEKQLPPQLRIFSCACSKQCLSPLWFNYQYGSMYLLSYKSLSKPLVCCNNSLHFQHFYERISHSLSLPFYCELSLILFYLAQETL